MPLPSDYKGAEVTKGGSGISGETVPEDVYQVEITDINLRTGVPNFKKPEILQDWLDFDLTIIEKGEFYGKVLKFSATNKWRPKVGQGQPSNLWLLAEAVFGETPPELKEDETFDPTQLIGGQVRVTVKNNVSKTTNETYSNVQKNFLTIKEKLPKFNSKDVLKENDDEDDEEIDMDQVEKDLSGGVK